MNFAIYFQSQLVYSPLLAKHFHRCIISLCNNLLEFQENTIFHRNMGIDNVN